MNDENRQLNNNQVGAESFDTSAQLAETEQNVEIAEIVGVGECDERLEGSEELDCSDSIAQSDSFPEQDVCERSAQGTYETVPNAIEKQKQQRNKKADKILTIILVVLIAFLVIGLVLRLFVGCRIGVSGESMLPNFVDGQVVWVNKTISPKRGDVVVLYRNDVDNKFLAEFSTGESGVNGKYEKLIKRAVAFEGDRLWLESTDGGKILVIKTADGEILHEDFYKVHGEPAKFYNAEGDLGTVAYLGNLGNLAHTSEENPYVVPEGKFYFLGDNRFNSNDSRVLGVFPLSRVYGVVVS